MSASSDLDLTGNRLSRDLVAPSFFKAWLGVWSLTWRSRVVGGRLVLWLALLLIIPLLVCFSAKPGVPKAFHTWLVVYLFLVPAVAGVTSCGGMIRDELQAQTLGFLLTRPVKRMGFFVIKYLCHVLWVQAALAVQLLLVIAVGVIRQVPEMGELLLLALGIQASSVLAWASLGSLFGLLSRWYLPLAVLYGFLVELGLGRIPININNLAITNHVQTLLGLHELFAELFQFDSEGWLKAMVFILLTALVYLGLAAVLFHFKEYRQSPEA